MLWCGEIGIAVENDLGDAPCFFQNSYVAQLGDFQIRQTRLTCAEKFAGSAQFQILFRQTKTVLSRFDDFEAFVARALFFLREQETKRLLVSAPDASAELMELRQAKTICAFDHHYGGVRHVDADFDHGGGDEHIDLAVTEFI